MKKRLEAELISIAHRVLKLKNKSEIDQLYHETRKLYETLTVLKFYGDNYELVKSEISEPEFEENLNSSFENQPVTLALEKSEPEVIDTIPNATIEEETTEPEEPIIVGEITLDEEDEEEEIELEEEIEAELEEVEEKDVEEVEEEIIQEEEKLDTTEDIKEDTSFDLIFELAADEIKEDSNPEKIESKQISFDDILGENYSDLEFVKPNDITKPKIVEEVKEEEKSSFDAPKEEKPSILNEKLITGINIGLNDRIGFVKYLFDNSNEDFNRVISQLNTFDSFSEAKEFIDDMVKPDYNNWLGNEDYAERFMEIVEQKFA